MKNKGMSPVIATIALILLTITAVGIIASFTVPFVRDSLYGSTECVDYKEYFTFYQDFDYNCYVSAGNYWGYGVSVAASSVCEESDSSCEEIVNKVDGFTLRFSAGGESQPATVKISSPASSEVNGIRMLNASKTELEVPISGEVKTYVYNSSYKYDLVEIYPLLKSGTVCEKSDSVRIGEEICTATL